MVIWELAGLTSDAGCLLSFVSESDVPAYCRTQSPTLLLTSLQGPGHGDFHSLVRNMLFVGREGSGSGWDGLLPFEVYAAAGDAGGAEGFS